MRKAIGLVQRPMVKQELLPYRLSDRDHRSDAFTQAAFSWQGNAVPSALSFDTVSGNGLWFHDLAIRVRAPKMRASYGKRRKV
jgi:hypothetical protein